jgi:hypothetical protein
MPEFAVVEYQGSVERLRGQRFWLEYCGDAECGQDWASGGARYELVDNGGVTRLRHVRGRSVRAV